MRCTPLIAAALAPCLACPMVASAQVETRPQSAPGTFDTSAPPRYILLREGSRLVSVRGTMVRNDDTGAWRFHIAPDDPTAPGYVLVLLPCAQLEDMRHVLRQMPDERITFEVAGEVYVYNNSNYLLPTHAPSVVAVETTPLAPAEQTHSDAPSSDTADDIMLDLERSVGALPRRTTAVPVDDGASSREGSGREGTVVLARRGQLARSRGGAWLFVFDADAEGLADPPMVIMPCLLMERLEAHVQKAGMNAPLLMTGRAYTFDRRGYLLPSLFTVPLERTVLHP